MVAGVDTTDPLVAALLGALVVTVLVLAPWCLPFADGEDEPLQFELEVDQPPERVMAQLWHTHGLADTLPVVCDVQVIEQRDSARGQERLAAIWYRSTTIDHWALEHAGLSRDGRSGWQHVIGPHSGVRSRTEVAPHGTGSMLRYSSTRQRRRRVATRNVSPDAVRSSTESLLAQVDWARPPRIDGAALAHRRLASGIRHGGMQVVLWSAVAVWLGYPPAWVACAVSGGLIASWCARTIGRARRLTALRRELAVTG